MLALALSAEIEPDCARGFIAEFGIIPESSDVEHWPWPIRIQTLGGFALKLDGVPVRSARKAQKKPLELLKALVSQGGHEAGTAAIAEMLWPEAEGDAALEALEVTLRRLRKLLGRDEAVRLHEGRLALNEGLCWVDTRAFERAHERADALLTDGRIEGHRCRPRERRSAVARRCTPDTFWSATTRVPGWSPAGSASRAGSSATFPRSDSAWEDRGAPAKSRADLPAGRGTRCRLRNAVSAADVRSDATRRSGRGARDLPSLPPDAADDARRRTVH